MYLDTAKAKFSEVFQGTNFVPKPASEGEIQEMEQELHLTFPPAYREFLLWMGHGAGGFASHFIFNIHRLPRNQESARELIEDEGLILPDDEIVFCWGNQGYYFKFIQAHDGDNPKVHDYYEGEGFLWEHRPDLQNFILNCIKWYEERPELLARLRAGYEY